MDWQSQLSTCQDSAYIDTVSKITGESIPVLKDYYYEVYGKDNCVFRISFKKLV